MTLKDLAALYPNLEVRYPRIYTRKRVESMLGTPFTVEEHFIEVHLVTVDLASAKTLASQVQEGDEAFRRWVPFAFGKDDK